MRASTLLCAGALVVLVGGCGGGGTDGGDATPEPVETDETIDPAALPPPPPGGFGGPVSVRVGDAPPVTAELAETPEQRSYGLRGRDEVPPGSGMLFVYAEPQTVRFVMSGVPIPLTAVFVRDGEVVAVAEMAPCTTGSPEDCPRYGPDADVDAVLEVAPPSLPDVAVGQAVVVEE